MVSIAEESLIECNFLVDVVVFLVEIRELVKLLDEHCTRPLDVLLLMFNAVLGKLVELLFVFFDFLLGE